MVSTDSTSDWRTRWMPALAILRHELGSLAAGWLVRLWLIATIVLTLLILAGSWGSVATPRLIGGLLMPYLVFPWFLVVMVLGISPVTGSRLESLSDGILCRPITRSEYLLAAWAARVVAVLAVFGIVMLPAVLLVVFAERNVADERVTLYGVTAALAVVSLVLTLLVSLGFLVGTLLRRPLLAAVVLLFVWVPINMVLDTFRLEELSPTALSRAIPSLVRTPWRTADEPPPDQAAQEDLAAMAAQADQFLRLLSGGSPRPKRPPRQNEFFVEDFEDLAVWRVVLGYGLPTLLALGLAAAVFQRRDL